jgi:hypothetical protein
MNIDKKIHEVSEFFNTCKFSSLKQFLGGESWYEYYYAENELYVVRNKFTKEFYFINAKSPKDAYENLLRNLGGKK